MNIGQASARSGLSSKTIRYYEAIDLVTPARQPRNHYRDYSEADLAQLSFLNSARQLGFNLDECRSLLELHRNPERACPEMRDLALAQVQKLDEQRERLNKMRATLMAAAAACPGGEEPNGNIPQNSERLSPKMSFTLMEADS